MAARSSGQARKDVRCNTCTLKLVSRAYQRAPWFHLVREPLKWGMRLFAWVHRIDPQEYRVRTPACTGCLRFYKVALKERSPVFRRLNDWVNPLFDAWLERFITPDELAQAQAYARRASDGEVPSDEAQAWLPGPKVGF